MSQTNSVTQTDRSATRALQTGRRTIWLLRPHFHTGLVCLSLGAATVTPLLCDSVSGQEQLLKPVISALPEFHVEPLVVENIPTAIPMLELASEVRSDVDSPVALPVGLTEEQALEVIPPIPESDAPTVMVDPQPMGVLISDGGEDPRYRSSRLSSFYAICPTCGHKCCRCVYAPFGDTIHGAFARQIRNGSSELMTLYNYDFYPLTTSQYGELTPRGIYQVEKIARRAEFTPTNIRLQATGNEQLDTTRLAAVVQELEKWGISGDRVVLISIFAAPSIPVFGPDSLKAIQSPGWTLQSASRAATFSGTGTNR